MLALLVSCCGLRHHPHEPSTERAPLIPPSDDNPSQVLSRPSSALLTPSSPQPRVIDHRKLKERLGSAVRSKEGKMVNVNAHFPFNLHGRDHYDSSTSSSRNVSGGTLSSSRAPSPSPPRQLQKSPSAASFAEDVPHYLPLQVNPSPPVLNVRLLKSARSTQSPRGRPQRTGEPNGRTQPLDPEPASLSASALHEHSSAHPPVNPQAPPYPEDFNIHDAGAVARSWGD